MRYVKIGTVILFDLLILRMKMNRSRNQGFGNREALEDYIRATNSHDFEVVKKVLHREAIYYFSDQTCKTTEAIKAYFENAWHLIKEEVYEARDVVWVNETETSACCVYTYYYQGYLNGDWTEGKGRATNLFVHTEAGWKLRHEHLSG